MPEEHPIYNRAYFERPTIERQYFDQRKVREDQQVVLDYVRGPRVLSVGCGLGFLEHLLAERGLSVIAVDVADNRQYRDFWLLKGGMDAIPKEHFGTAFFCESLEHIPEEEFERNWPIDCGRLIISNWAKFHPIYATGWDHIRQVDNRLFDRLAENGTVVYRNGSQIVIDYQ